MNTNTMPKEMRERLVTPFAELKRQREALLAVVRDALKMSDAEIVRLQKQFRPGDLAREENWNEEIRAALTEAGEPVA